MECTNAKNIGPVFEFEYIYETRVGPIIMLGSRWVVKNIKFIKFYTQELAKYE